jgi:Zn ribbon nucleic-acid-binding protein
LLTTLLCPRHGTQVGDSCPGCNRDQLTVVWNQDCMSVRCMRCDWHPLRTAKSNEIQIPSNPVGSLQLLFRLQCDIAAALRDQAPSSFWCGPISAVHFLRVVDDLYWLLRTPGLCARAGKNFTFTQDFTWTRPNRESRTLFTRTQHWPFGAWDNYSRAEVLVAIAATMLGTRAFGILGSMPHYPEPTAYYPWDWILPALHNLDAQEFMGRVSRWPIAMRLPVSTAAREVARIAPPGTGSTSYRPYSTS